MVYDTDIYCFLLLRFNFERHHFYIIRQDVNTLKAISTVTRFNLEISSVSGIAFFNFQNYQRLIMISIILLKFQSYA